MPGRNLKLLCLDGGGVRGLSSLYILQRLMESIDAENPPKPCEYFDIIGGTSTGGYVSASLYP
jgi:patatin-like phospholipase/acyl hydrolase